MCTMIFGDFDTASGAIESIGELRAWVASIDPTIDFAQFMDADWEYGEDECLCSVDAVAAVEAVGWTAGYDPCGVQAVPPVAEQVAP